MANLTPAQAAAALGVTRQRVMQLLAAKRVKGARRVVGRWWIPAPPTVLPGKANLGRPRKG